MMIKISLRLVRATHEGVVIAQRAVRTYTRYAFYSFRDRKGKQSNGSKSTAVDGPRHGLVYNNVEDFLLSQWSDSPVPYAIYRTIVAAYFFLMVFYTAIYGALKYKMLIMLTYWSYYILVACQILRAFNCWYYIGLQKRSKDAKVCLRNQPRIKLQWILHNVASDSAFLVSILYWTIAYDGNGFNFINCNTHGINAVFVIADTFVTRTPVRMLHSYHTSALGVTYGVFAGLYWLAGGTNLHGQPYIYKPLDFSRFKVALSYIVVSALIIAPIIHCWIFFLYRFRLFIHRYLRAMEKRNDPPSLKVS